METNFFKAVLSLQVTGNWKKNSSFWKTMSGIHLMYF